MKTLFLCLALVGAACQKGELHIDSPDTNASPFADAGVGGTFELGDAVTLDASGSYDPDGTIVSYRWRLVTFASGSSGTIANPNLQVASFVFDAPGDYVFELSITDNDNASARSTVAFHVTAPQLLGVNAGVDQSVPLHANVQLAGTFDAEPNAAVSVQWTVVSKPAGSTATLTAASTLTPSFNADREGPFVLRLDVNTPYQSLSDDVTVTAVVARQLLEYALVDAEYSTALDQFVIVSDSPPRLRLHDANTNTETLVTLPAAPVAVSVAPNGLRAAVAHASSVTIVDLQTLAVSAPYTMPSNLYDVVFGADGRVHCFHRGNDNQPIRTLDVATGTVTDSQGWVYGNTEARLHPSTTVVYGATTLLSPADIERYDVVSVPVQVGPDSPYHGQYDMGGPLWFTQTGSSIITGSGNIFYSSADPMFDMTYQGTLGLGSYNWVVHSSAAGKLAALRTEYDAFFNPSQYLLRIYDEQFTLLSSVTIPDTPYNNVVYRSAGRFAAFSADSTSLYVIARAGASPGVVHALYTFEP